MKTYQHTQLGNWTLIIVAVLGTVFTLMSLIAWPFLFSLPVLILLGWLFHSLTIEITDDELRWRFGPGLIRGRVPLSDIASAQPVRTNLFEGWGIHHSRFGCLYNVSGFDAVAITLKNGKRLCLGTDEPEELAANLSKSICQK